MNKAHKNPSDNQLLEHLIKEEVWAFEHLYRSYYRMVAHYVNQNNGNNEDAKDAFQDTIVALLKAINKPEFQLQKGTKLGTFIYAIARRIWLMKLREKRIVSRNLEHLEDKLVYDDSGIEEKKVFEQKHLLLAKILKKIGKECRQLLDAYYFKKIPLNEVARLLGYTDGFVRVKKNRCMNEFRKKIKLDSDFQKLQND